MAKARIRQDGAKVLLEIGGRSVELPHEAALELGRGLVRVARMAETYANANRIISDQALLTRSGAPFGIVPRGSKMMDVARNEAAFGRDPRRTVPTPSVRSEAIVGTPGLRQHPPAKKEGNGHG